MSFEWKEPIPLPNSYQATEVDYDLDLLPKSIKVVAEEIARFAKVPIASPAIVGLSCVAVAIGKKSIVVEKPGLEHYPSMFLVLIAASGERKSPIFGYMKQPLDDWCENQMDDYKNALTNIRANNIIIDELINKVRRDIKKKGADTNALMNDLIAYEDRRQVEPPYPSLYTTDTTEERLFQKMHERDATYAVMSGEGRGALDQILGKYTSGGGTGDALYLQGISGDTATRDRVGGGSGPEELRMSKPCLNVCIMVQPDKYREVASHPSLRESGALARIWPVYLSCIVGTRLEEEYEAGLNSNAIREYNNMMDNILSAKPPKKNNDSVHRVLLSDDVVKARRKLHNQIEKMMAVGDKLEDVRDIASKAVTQTVKIAQILHIANNPNLLNHSESAISIDTWNKAEKLGKFHLNEAVRIQRTSIEDLSIVYASKLINWIKKQKLKQLTTRDVQQKGPRPRLKISEVTVVLNLLCEYGYLFPTSANYLVNPKIL